MLLFIFTFVCYGITQVIVEAEITSGFRKWLLGVSTFLHSMLTCMMCTGFWVGIGVSVAGLSPVSVFPVLHPVATVFDGFLASALVWYLHIIELNICRR